MKKQTPQQILSEKKAQLSKMEKENDSINSARASVQSHQEQLKKIEQEFIVLESLKTHCEKNIAKELQQSEIQLHSTVKIRAEIAILEAK